MKARTLILLAILLSTSGLAIPPDFSCWNTCTSQCYGDADCLSSGVGAAKIRVNTLDLQILMNTYPWPCRFGNVLYDPRADVDRNLRIDEGDQIKMADWFGKTGCPADCAKKLVLTFYRPQLRGGSTQTVTWDWNIFTDYIPLPGSEDQPGLIALYYQVNGGTWTSAGNVSGGYSLFWNVPEISGQYRLRIVDQTHWGLEDISPYFEVVACPLTMDTDDDCTITMADFAAFSANWLKESGGKTFDDLLVLADTWLMGVALPE